MRSHRLPIPACVALGSMVLGICLWESAGAARRPRPPSTVDIGLQATPVPLNLKGKNKALVGLGSYIINVKGSCNDCHTNPPFKPGGDPYQGQPKQINTTNFLAGGTPFGPILSQNITPDSQGLPNGHTYLEFIGIMRQGFSHHHPGVLQVMPWPVYGKMTDLELRAVYEYLRSIPHAGRQPSS